jgi:hypothetical protein
MLHNLALALVASLMMLGFTANAGAQSVNDSPAAQALGGSSAPGGSGPPGGSSGFGHHRDQGGVQSAAGSMPELKPIVAPRQRLDTGALLCHTEAQLRQHQAAIMARLEGRQVPDATGCHLVGETAAVSVLMRDGQAATEVQLAGDEPVTGWTDAVIRDADPLHGPMK